MKQPERQPRAHSKQPRPVVEPALATVVAGAAREPAPPWTPEQHSETLVRAPR